MIRSIPALFLSFMAAAALAPEPADAQRRGGGGGGTHARAAAHQNIGGGGANRAATRNAAAGHNVNRGANVNRDANVNRNANLNRNTNINNNRNINVNRDIDIDVDNGWHDGWDHPIAAGVAFGTAAAVTSAAIGSILYSPPAACPPYGYGGYTYYYCNNVWYQPQYSGSSVTYVVVNDPR